MKLRFGCTLVTLMALTSCSGQAKNSPDSAETISDQKGLFYATPDDALNAYYKILADRDYEAYKQYKSNEKYPTSEKMHDEVVRYLVDDKLPIETAARVMLFEMHNNRPIREEHKQFPAQIDGDQAMILIRYIRSTWIEESTARFFFKKHDQGWASWNSTFSKLTPEEAQQFPWTPGPGVEEDQIDPTMKAFMAEWGQNRESYHAAVEKYGSSSLDPEARPAEPRVLSVEQRNGTLCYTVRGIPGDQEDPSEYITNTYYWKDGKLVKIEDTYVAWRFKIKSQWEAIRDGKEK